MPTVPFKGELERVSFQSESSFGVFNSGNWQRFGIMHGAQLPDLENMFDPQRVIGEGRNWKFIGKPRQEYRGAISNIWLQNGVPLWYVLGACSTGGGSPYTHAITEASQIPSFTMDVINSDAALNVTLIRRFLGCKINRATLEASEGGPLIMNIDELQAQKVVHDRAGIRNYDASLSDHSENLLTTQPYFFFEGIISIASNPIARVRSFRLEVANTNEAPYYVQNDNPDQPVIYSIDEGPRNYRITMTYDIDDVVLFNEALKGGPLTPGYYGCNISLTFQRGNVGTTDQLVILCPPSQSPAADDPGCYIRSNPIQQVESPLIPVQLVSDVPSIEIDVNDDLDASYYQ